MAVDIKFILREY